jgi:hypothetical protein
MTFWTSRRAHAIGALAFSILSLAPMRAAMGAGFSPDPRCLNFRDPVVCTCYIQNGGWFGYHRGQYVVWGPPNHMLIDVINNCMLAAGAASPKQ